MKMFKISKIHKEMVKVVVMLTMLAKKYKFVEMSEAQTKNECLITEEIAYMFRSFNGLFVLWVETENIIEKTLKAHTTLVNRGERTNYIYFNFSLKILMSNSV